MYSIILCCYEIPPLMWLLDTNFNYNYPRPLENSVFFGESWLSHKLTVNDPRSEVIINFNQLSKFVTLNLT